jgi:alkylated DNA repair dioxygenase AlkB
MAVQTAIPGQIACLAIKRKLQEQCGITINRVLLIYYRDSNDSVAWHSDTLPADGKHHPIASVTFGEALQSPP